MEIKMDTNYAASTAATPRTQSGEAAPGVSAEYVPQTETPVPQEAQAIDMSATREFRVSEEDIRCAVAMANKKAEPVFLEFQYQIHDKTNRLMISVINTQTQEVVREIPPERVLDALGKMWEMAGILLDERK